MNDDKNYESNEVTGASTHITENDEIIELSDDEGIQAAGVMAEAKIEWSDDERDPQHAYEAFKNRKSLKRKRVAARLKVNGGYRTQASVVGKRSKSLLRNDKTEKAWGDDSEIIDDGNPEDFLPEYLKQRKAEFEAKKIELETAGLQLPPSFNELDFSDEADLQSLREKPIFSNIEPCAPYEDVSLPYSLGVIPAPIAQWLRDYQVSGVAFLHELFVYQKGGILGDDMGLGKTIQVIAMLTAAFGKTGDERDAKRMRKMRRALGNPWYPKIIIICPGTLMRNWQSEFRTWGWWHVDIFHGSTEAKENCLQAAQAGRLEIMITTYTTYRLNQAAINMIQWDCVIADECHTIKERASEITKAMQVVNGLCRIGLTGTAIQNNYDELWTLLNWSNPGRFGPLSTWKTHISEPLKIGQSHDATVPQLARARTTARKLVKNLLPEFFLRRMKTLISHQLPKKSDRVVFCPLTELQAKAYENFTSSEHCEYIRRSTELCDCDSKKKRGWCCHMYIPGFGKWQNAVFPCIITLQKLANHVALLIPSGSMTKEKQDRELEHLMLALPNEWPELYRQRDNIITFAKQELCGKWKVLKKLLRFWHENGDKVLVFSHSVRLLKMLQMLFGATTSYNVSYLDGAMSYEERAKAVDEFNSDPLQFVFLISTRAGGVGLNITSANKVVVVDPNWNPAYDLQAQDRAYRIGQVRNVEVFRLVSAGTIEEIVYARQIYKQQQANIGYNASTERRYFTGVQDTKEKKGEIFGLANLFAYQGDNIVLRQIVNKTNVAESRAGVQVIGMDIDQSEIIPSPSSPSLDHLNRVADDAMTELAALVEAGASETTPAAAARKTDAVTAILASAGVEYTHENSEVVGSSRIEGHLSRRAENAVDDLAMRNEQVFASSQSVPDPFTALDAVADADAAVVLGDESSAALRLDAQAALARRKYRYRPPEDVRRRQFCTMAAGSRAGNVLDFALMVEGWTQEQRRDWLDRFYEDRRQEWMTRGGRDDASEDKEDFEDESYEL